MNTGFPRHLTVSCVPGVSSEISTRILSKALTSAAGFIWLTSGQIAAPVTTAPAPAVAKYRKSRRSVWSIDFVMAFLRGLQQWKLKQIFVTDCIATGRNGIAGVFVAR